MFTDTRYGSYRNTWGRALDSKARKIRPFQRDVEVFQKNLLTILKTEQDAAIAHLIPPQNNHVYEHGLKVNYQDDQNKDHTKELNPLEAGSLLELPKIVMGDFGHYREFVTTMVEGMSRVMHEMFYRNVTEATTEVGNVVDGGGKPLSAEVLLELYDKVEYSLNLEGKLATKQLVMAPEMVNKAKAIHEDKGFHEKFEKLMERKLKEAKEAEQKRLSRFPKAPKNE